MKTRTIDAIQVVDISGRFDTSSASPVANWLERVTSIPGARILVNLADTTFVDSTALATLVQALKRTQQHGGELALCSLRRPVFMIFELTRLDKAFTIFVDEPHALQSLRS